MLATWGFHELTFGRLQVWCNWATIAIATRSLRQLLEHVHTLIKPLKDPSQAIESEAYN